MTIEAMKQPQQLQQPIQQQLLQLIQELQTTVAVASSTTITTRPPSDLLISTKF